MVSSILNLQLYKALSQNLSYILIDTKIVDQSISCKKVFRQMNI